MSRFYEHIDESIWSDMQDRSAGETIRKEDDVNNLGLNEFYEYIKDQYKTKVEYIDLDAMGDGNGDVLGVDITENVILFYKPKRGHILLSWSSVKIPMPFFDELTDRFKVVNPNVMRRIITEKDGSCTNKTFVDVIDFFLEHIDNIVVKESIWSDMQDRSAGEKIRKEDEMTQDDLDALDDFIFGFASRVVWDGMRDSLTNFLKYIDENPEALDCDIKRVKKYVEDNWHKGICDDVETAIEQEEKEKEQDMNESLWSDMQDRSTGYGVRKEDITEEDKKEINYSFNGFAYLIVYTDYEPTIDDFIKMMKEAYPDRDNSKYIAWVRLNWDKKYKDELDKKIQDNKKDVDKRINRYLNNFVGQIVYCEKYNVSLPDIKRFSDEILKHCGIPTEMRFVGKIRVDESWLDIFKKYVDENWNDVKKRINDFIVEENQKIAKTGFKKTPGKKICDILDEWWDSLGDEKNDIAWNEFIERAEEKYYERHNPKYNEYTGEDFDADEEWSDASWIESVEIYMKYNQKTNESIWSDIQDRSIGDAVRKEEDLSLKDKDFLKRHTFRNFAKKIVYCESYSNTLSNFEHFVRNNHLYNVVVDGKKPYADYVKRNWDKGDDIHSFINDTIEQINKQISMMGFKKVPGETIEETLNNWWESLDYDVKYEMMRDTNRELDPEDKYEHPEDMWDDTYVETKMDIYLDKNKIGNLKESIWSDMQDRSTGDTVRKEDEMNDDDFLMLRETAKMFRNVLNRSANEPWSGTCDDFIKYINLRKKEHFWNDTPDEAYDKVIKFVKDNWGDCTGIQEFMDKYLSNINECDGVPGGLTSADIGGMGAAYFPGPNGEPGSGDLPSPTGIVYKQVAPFDTFIKMRRPKKNKKKKFRKEDEVCAKYDNHPVCKHIDDFRDYVNRVYNQIDRKK